jgi:beta-lactamase superfamily II metal-dependent hydrolase
MSGPLVRVAFLDVGQADTIVISIPEAREAVVVDCVDASSVFEYLSHEKVAVVRALVITHLHKDHYRQAAALLDNCERRTGARWERLILYTVPETEIALRLEDDHSGHDLRLWPSFASWILRNSSRVCSPNNSPELPIDGLLGQRIAFVYPAPALLPFARSAGFNNTSIVLRVDGQGTSALLTGDLEPAGWKLLKERSGQCGMARVDVLKFPHHGAWKEQNGAAADAQEFLEYTGAKTVIISVGTEQRNYSHPGANVFSAIRARNLWLLCTQATKQCGGQEVMGLRSQVVQELLGQAGRSGVPRSLCSSGCPCAGTVVVDLGEHVELIRPDALRHRSHIIKAAFRKHQCAV